MKLHANDVVPPNGGDKRSTMIGPRKDMRFISRLEMIAVQEIGLAGYDQRMRTRQSHIVPDHMRHLDGRIVPLDQPRSDARRVGKECVSTCGSRWLPDHSKKKKNKKT